MTWLDIGQEVLIEVQSVVDVEHGESIAEGARHVVSAPNSIHRVDERNPSAPMTRSGSISEPSLSVTTILPPFSTTAPNEIVKPVHLKAMPAILTTPEEVDLWLTGSWDDVKHLQHPLPRNVLVIVEAPVKLEGDALL